MSTTMSTTALNMGTVPAVALANMSFSQAVAHPTFVEDFASSTVALPGWMCELYARRMQAKASGSSIRSKSLRPKAATRAANCKTWFKKDNYSAPVNGIRERKPLALSPQERGSKHVMPPPLTELQYQRHAIHLMSALLSIRTNASPFTLVLDDLNQRAMPFLVEMAARALSRNVNVIIVSFEGTRFPDSVRHVPAWGNRTAAQILHDVEQAMSDCKESLVIVDSMHDAIATKNIDTTALFDLVVVKFASTLVGVYHTDMVHHPSSSDIDVYAPQPLDVLKFMATSIVTCRSLAHVLAAKVARERSLPEPTYGMFAGAEGIVQCLNANDTRGIVLETEFRRRSGRAETYIYFLRPALNIDYHQPLPHQIFGTLKQEFVILMDQHPAYANKELIGLVAASADGIDASFNLSLTQKQKAAREEVVLPYTDAQKQEGGEGGRILYEMGEEDDFDEEEDEI